MIDLNFSELRTRSVERCEQVFHKLNDWSPTDWACAMAGECGEACNAIKKIKRMETRTNTAKDPQTYEEAVSIVGDELADMVIYADLLAARLGIDLGAAVVRKFNAVSERMRSTVFIQKGKSDE